MDGYILVSNSAYSEGKEPGQRSKVALWLGGGGGGGGDISGVVVGGGDDKETTS